MSKRTTMHVSFFNGVDLARVTKLAKAMKFRSRSEWVRHLINGAFLMMEWKPLAKLVKTCRNGHDYTPANTGRMKIKGRMSRFCRECRRQRRREWHRRRALKNAGTRKRRLYFRIQDDHAAQLVQQHEQSRAGTPRTAAQHSQHPGAGNPDAVRQPQGGQGLADTETTL